MKILKPTAILLALCIAFSGCALFEKSPAEEENIISGEGNLSADVEITPEIPESSESSSSEPEPERNGNNAGIEADLIKYGSEEMIKAILPVVDDYERAIQAFDQNEDTAALKEGVVLIYNKLINTLSQKGLKAIEAKGEKFDENLHEAVAQFPATDEEQKGKVIDEVLKGYYLHDKVIRYAKVVVAI